MAELSFIQMKRSFLILILFLLALSCDKYDSVKEYNYLTYILAGQKEGIGIWYIDVEPDDTLKIFDCELDPQAQRNLDLNQDGILDFSLEYKISSCSALGGSWSYFGIAPLGNNSVCVSKVENTWAEALHYNDTINENNNWSDSTALLFEHLWYITVGPVYDYGYWPQDTDIFVAVRIVRGEHTFYGWLDINRNILRQYTISIPFKI
jgi:hypothetical protein